VTRCYKSRLTFPSISLFVFKIESRYGLGFHESSKGKDGRALRHYLISAKMGHETSLNMVKKMFMNGIATKAQYTEALNCYQDAVEETKSPERQFAFEKNKSWKMMHP